MTEDKLSAYQTLYTCLKTISLLIAPIAPFFADKLYRDLNGTEDSVHLATFPECDEAVIDKNLEERMALAQTITSMVLALRRKVNIKVRQPLQTVMVPIANDQHQTLLAVKDLILGEVNVKEMKIVASDEGILVKRVKPDFKKLGPKFGKQMKAVAATLTALDTAAICAFEKDGFIEIELDGTPSRVDLSDVDVFSEDIPGWLVANEGAVTVAIDITPTPELKAEGVARDIVNRVQNIRKGRDYQITDRINLHFEPNELTDAPIEQFGEYISSQVLASSIVVGEFVDTPETEHLDLDGVDVRVNITLS